MNETMMDVVKNKIASKIRTGSETATQAVSRLIEEGSISNDFIAPIGVKMLRSGEDPIMTFSANDRVMMDLPDDSYTLHKNAITQLGEKLKIPTAYIASMATGDPWQRMVAAHLLNQHSLNTSRSRALVRAVGTEVRGVLSDSYSRLNSVDLLTTFLQEATKQGGLLADGHIDDTRVYVEVLMPQPFIINTPKNGEVAIAFGTRLSTSDYGDGALDMRTFFMQGVCLNGMVRESILRKIHLGERLPDNIQLSEKTYRLETQKQCSAITDITKQLFSKKMLDARIHEIEASSEIEVDLTKELNNLQKGGRLLKNESDSIQKLLMRSNPKDGIQGESTLWKLTQAISAQARELDPRRSRDLQEVAGDLMQRVHSI